MNEENKMHARLAYKCGICGKEHDNVLSRAKCEIECSKKAEAEAKKAAEAKKQADKKVREAEVTKAIDNAYNLIDKFMEDYGTYTYRGESGQFEVFQNARIKYDLENYLFDKLLGKFLH